MLEALIVGVADRAVPTPGAVSIPWAGIGMTLEQIRSKLEAVQVAIDRPVAVAAATAQSTPAAPSRRPAREIEILDEASFNSERRIVDSRPAPPRGPLGTLSGRVQVAPTASAANGQSGKTRELGVKSAQSSGSPAAEALSNEEAVVVD